MNILEDALENDITFRELGIIMFVASYGSKGVPRDEILNTTHEGDVGLNRAVRKLAKRGLLIMSRDRNNGKYGETRYTLPKYVK